MRAAVSIARMPSAAGTWKEKLVGAGSAGLVGWEVGETQGGMSVKHLPTAFPLSLEAGTGGHGGWWRGVGGSWGEPGAG